MTTPPPQPPPPSDLKSLITSSYNTIAPTYNTWTTPTHSVRLTHLSSLLPLLPPHSQILELGCGAGIPTTSTLVASGHSVIANDISPVQISLAERNVPEAICVAGDMLSLSFPPETFDAVVGMYSLIHLPRGEQKVMAAKIARWVKRGGWLLCNFGEEEVEGKRGVWLGAEMFWSGWGVEGSKRMVEEVGFEILEGVVEGDLEDGEEVRFLWVLGRRV